MNETALTPIQRPNGKIYRSRAVTANAVVDEDQILSGVIVLGTHDRERAQPLADRYARWQLGSGYAAASPRTGWYRDAFEGGERRWITDEERGRAGVYFAEIAEIPPSPDPRIPCPCPEDSR
jgi:hypothetical protein